jgi:Mce-associated membrane protein
VTNDVRDTAVGSGETGSAATEAGDEDESVTGATGVGDELADDAEVRTERRWRRLAPGRRTGRILTALLVVLLLISGGVATWLYFKQYRPDQQTDPAVAQSVAGAASDGTVALLSYSADSLDEDFAAARSHLAGDFLSYYNDFSQQFVSPAAKQKSLKTTARVTDAAVSELHPDSAVVLVFVDQSTTTKDSPQPLLAVRSVLVRMARVNGNWLITKFTPV